MDKLNRPFNNAKQTLRNMRDIEEILQKIDIGVFENANNILDPVDGKYKSIKEFSVEYFGGATTENILRWVAKNNQTYSLLDNYSKGEFTLYVNENTKEGLQVVSKVDNNVGNLPPQIANSENDFWYSLVGGGIPIDEIVNALKPFIVQEIERQLPDVVNKFANDNPAFSEDLILLANGDTGVEHFKTTYNVPDANVDVSDFGEVWENIGFTHDNLHITLNEHTTLFSQISIVGNVEFEDSSLTSTLNLKLNIDEITVNSYYNCASSPIYLFNRVGFNKEAHNMVFHVYNFKNEEQTTPKILNTSELKIKGVRK